MAAKRISIQYDHRKIPILGLVPESLSSAPATPVNGQLWYDTSINRFKVYENGAWVLSSLTGAELLANKDAAGGYPGLTAGKLAIGAIPTGTTGSTVPFGNDARLSDTRTPTDNTVSTAKIQNGAVTDVQVAAANKDGAAGTASLRTLGFSATQALAGTSRLDQIAIPTAPVDYNGQRITGVGAPINPADVARLSDLQGAQAGIDNKPSARLISVTQRALTGLAAIDGLTPAAGERVLLVGQTAPAENGPYVAAAGAWARATDGITSGAFWLVTEGSTYGGSQWKVATADPIVVGTTPLSITQWGAPGTVYVGTTNRVTVAGSVVDISPNYVGQASITTLGTVTAGVWNGTTVAVANGGTGQTTAAAAIVALGGMRRSTALLGALTAGVEASYTHNLNTMFPLEPSFQLDADKSYLALGSRVIDANTIGITSDETYGANAIRAIVVG